VEEKAMLSQHQNTRRFRLNLPGGFSENGFLLSLFLACLFLVLAVVSTVVSVPFEDRRIAAAVLILWVMGLASLLSAGLCWKRRNVSGIMILLLFFWAGVLFWAFVSEGFGVFLGSGAFLVAAVFAAQIFPANLINQVMGVGTLVGGAAFFLDFLGPENRLTAPAQLQMVIAIVVGLILMVFFFALFWQFRKFSLLIKLLLPIVTFSLLSIFILAAYNNTMTRQALLASENQALRAAAQKTSTDLSAFINAANTSLITEAKLPVFVNYLSLPEEERSGSSQETEAITLLRYLQARGYILSYNLLDTTSRVWLSTLVAPEKAGELPQNLGINLTDPGAINILLLSGLPYISPVIFTPDGQPSLYFAARVDDTEGNPVGVLVSQYHASNLQATVAQSNNLLGSESGSFAVLLDENNLRLAQGVDPDVLYKFLIPPDPTTYAQLVSSRRIPNVSIDQSATNYPSFLDGMQKVNTSPYFTTQEAGTGDQIYSAAAVEVQGRKWVVVFMEPQSVFLQPIEDQSRTAILLAISIAAVLSLAVGIVARFIVLPVAKLTNVARIVTEGDLAAQAQVTNQDEIGVLANAFNTMTTKLRQTLEGLEQSVLDRTAELEKASELMGYRANQLQTVSDVARTIASVQDVDQLLPAITQTISERFGYYHVGIFLLDSDREYAVLQSANSEGGQRMLQRGHRLKVGQVGIVGYVTDRGEPRIALDVGQDAVFFNNPDLPDTRSEMALPLKIGNQVIGALDVQSTAPAAFGDEDIALLTTLADQVVIAIENSRLFGETRTALVEAQTAQREYLRTEWEKVTSQQSTLGYQYTFGRISKVSEPDGLVWDELDPQIVLIPNDSERQAGEPKKGRSGEAEQGLLVPISLRGQVIGMFKLQDIDQSRLWNEEEISFIQSVADQVGLALENARLLETTQRRAEREYLVGQITTKMRASNDPQVILQSAVTELRKALRVQKAQVIIQTQPGRDAESQADPQEPLPENDPAGENHLGDRQDTESSNGEQ
jgi:GAF domain-containing protein/HAMP domain-containing protein/MFS family permease